MAAAVAHDALQAASGVAETAAGGIRERDDTAHALVVVQHDQAAHLDIAHIGENVIHLIRVAAIFDVGAHHLTHLATPVEARGNAARDDVAVRHHADQPVVFSDREEADIFIRHPPGDFDNDVVGFRKGDVACHDF